MPIKKKHAGMTPLGRNTNTALYHDAAAEHFVFSLGYRPTSGGEEYSYTDEKCYGDPREAFNAYETEQRARFYNQLESIGYHRHNGEKIKYKAAPETVPHKNGFQYPGICCQGCRYGENGLSTCPDLGNSKLCINGISIPANA